MSKVVLQTDRFLICELALDDAPPAFLGLNRDPQMLRYPGDPCLRHLAEARAGLLARSSADYRKYGYGR